MKINLYSGGEDNFAHMGKTSTQYLLFYNTIEERLLQVETPEVVNSIEVEIRYELSNEDSQQFII